MKIGISTFATLLVLGLALVMFGLWSASLLLLVEDENQARAESFAADARQQLAQLRQDQRDWLEGQFFLLDSMLESERQRQHFQSFLWDYYQRNPGIWAVNLIELDDAGRALSRASKPGCLQPAQLRLSEFGEPDRRRISSCRVGDKALLEIAGRVTIDGGPALLLVSMDFFDFLNRYSRLSRRELLRSADDGEGIRYRELQAGVEDALTVVIALGGDAGIPARLELTLPRSSFRELFERQAGLVLLLLIGAVCVVLALLHSRLIRPLLELATDMRSAARSQEDHGVPGAREVTPGLEIMRKYLATLKKMAKRDPVTGLNNRVIFEDRLLQAIREGRRSGRKYALVLIELRGIDDIAQLRGRYIADALLRQVADSLRQSLRESDHLARFDRNLFALLLEVQLRELLDALIDKIYLSLVRRYRVYGREFDLRAHFGIALYPDDATDAASLYQNASDALVVAETSEWPIRFHQEAGEAADLSGFTMIQALRRAIDRDEFKLMFQPVVDLQSYQALYFEALLRWRDPGRHGTSIERTIQLAEQNHLIKPLTNWIIGAACRFVSECGIADMTVGINLSMIDLHDRLLPQRIETYLREYGVRPAQIVVEITESQIMQDPDEVVEVLAHLGVMGLSLSIDDFGTGQASLTYLKKLPVEKLKIDQSFVRDIASNPDDRLIVRATIELAHTLDLKVVAEGVETLEVYEILADMGCDHLQGYYISPPLEAEQVAGWLETAIKPDLVRKDR